MKSDMTLQQYRTDFDSGGKRSISMPIAGSLIVRTVLVTTAWFVFPDQRLLAIGLVIAGVYLLSIAQLLTRPLPGSAADTSRETQAPDEPAV